MSLILAAEETGKGGPSAIVVFLVFVLIAVIAVNAKK